jgi:2-oxoglutarate ferredoxin oxidoreductase subunit gamma
MRREIRIAGFGGQGIILAGIIVGKAASLFDGINAAQTQSYGPEARGGASKTEVVISDDEIRYPKLMSPDILVVMSHEALIAYIGDLKYEGMLIIDPDIVDESIIKDFLKEHKIKVYYARVNKVAEKDVGLRIVANIVMVGAIAKFTKVISHDAAKKAILESVPLNTEQKNIQAFEAGYAMDGS